MSLATDGTLKKHGFEGIRRFQEGLDVLAIISVCPVFNPWLVFFWYVLFTSHGHNTERTR